MPPRNNMGRERSLLERKKTSLYRVLGRATVLAVAEEHRSDIRETKIEQAQEDLMMTAEQVKRLVDLVPLFKGKLEPVRLDLMRYTSLRVFDAWEICYVAGGHVYEVYNITLLSSLVGTNLARSGTTTLDGLSSRLNDAAILRLTRFLIQSIAFAGTVTQFLSAGNTHIYPDVVLYSLRKYGSIGWANGNIMEPQNGRRTDLVAGWNIASTVITVNLQDFVNRAFAHAGNQARAVDDKITEDELNEVLSRWAAAIFEEVVGFMFMRLEVGNGGQATTIAEFMQVLDPHLDTIFRYLLTLSCSELEHAQVNAQQVNRDRLQGLLTTLRDGRPTMAEIHYCAEHMQATVGQFLPRHEVSYSSEQTYMRGRIIQDSTAYQDQVESIGAPVPVQTSHGSSRKPGPITDTRRYESTATSKPFYDEPETANPLPPPPQSMRKTADSAGPSTAEAGPSTDVIPTDVRGMQQVPLVAAGSIADGSSVSGEPDPPPPPRAQQIWTTFRDRGQYESYQEYMEAWEKEAGYGAVPEWAGGLNRQRVWSPGAHYRLRVVPYGEVTYTDMFSVDDAGDDDEHVAFNQGQRAPPVQGELDDPELEGNVELFYNNVCMWVLCPRPQGRVPGCLLNDGNISTPDHVSNAAWIQWFMTVSDGSHIRTNVSQILTREQYRDHLIGVIMLNMRADVRQALAQNQEIALLRTNPHQFMIDAIGEGTYANRFWEARVTSVDRSAYLDNLVTQWADNPQHAHDLLESIRGLTLALAVIRPGANHHRNERRPTRLMFLIIRRTVPQRGNLDRRRRNAGNATEITGVQITFSVSRVVMRSDNVRVNAGDSIFFWPVYSMASDLRAFRAAYQLGRLPLFFRKLLCGPPPVPINYTAEGVTSQVSRSTITPEMERNYIPPVQPNHVRDMIENEVNAGSLLYLRGCLEDPDVQVAPSHFNAAVQAMRVIGDATPGTSGICHIQGPPGTGKTTTILAIVGAILHHNEHGHMHEANGAIANIKRLPEAQRGYRPCSQRPRAMRILVTASSNAAVDNVLQRIHDRGIPDGNGGPVIRPQMVRIARQGYDFPRHLERYSVEERAQGFPTAGPADALLNSRRAMANTVIIYFATTTMVGSPKFLDLDQNFDVIIHDEAGQTKETDTIVALTNACALREPTELPNRRLYYISIGDDKQLPPMSNVPFMMKRAELSRRYNYDMLCESLFERMITDRRCTFVSLNAQFRMHPAISEMIGLPFYRHRFQSPIPAARFAALYTNADAGPNVFAPFTFIDTSTYADRFEVKNENHSGTITNPLEADIAASIIRTLLRDFQEVDTHALPPLNNLDRQIAIIAPYQSQVTEIRERVNALNELNYQRRRADLAVHISTVDSMQGSERDIVIFCVTRSNRTGNVGFVADMRRLNVSVSRARRCNIIIADSKMFTQERSTVLQPLAEMYRRVAAGTVQGAVLKQVTRRRGGNAGGAAQSGLPNWTLTTRQPTGAPPSTRSQAARQHREQQGLGGPDAGVDEVPVAFDFSTLFA